MRHLFLKRILVLLVLVIAVSACQQKTRKYQDNILAFGTIINVTLIDVDEKTAEESFRHIREDLKVMHRVWHVWEPGPLMRTNQLLQYTKEFSAAPSVLDLIVLSKELSIKSQHLFNPAIGKLIALWGFHSHKQPETPPSDLAIQKLLKQNPTMENIQINGVRISNNNAAVKIDLGGIAKGYAIDRLLNYLKQRGIHNALINTGGDLKVIGQHGDRPWKIAIRDPRFQYKAKNKDKQNTELSVVALLELRDNEAAFTSGDYERYFKNKKNNDHHLHHIIDHRTGYPAQGTQSVTVLHEDAATADAAATALFIAGPTRWVEIAKSMGVKYVLLINEKGDIHISSAMKKRVKFEQNRNIVEQAEL